MSTNSNIHKLSSNIGNIPSKHSQAQPQHKVNTVNSQSHSQTKPAQFSVPPRYQPPPHPPGGILKNIPSSKTAATAYQSETSNIPHLNIKYPPEVPKLATVYIPEGVRSSTTRSALPRPSNHRASTGQQYHRLSLEEEHLLRIQNHNQPAQSSEMLKFVRKSEAEGSTAATSNAARLTEQNRHLQSLINELRALKEANQLLSDDNQELRDLCCFLDDDRQKGRKLAREWQRFGRYTASVMRQEVSTYQNKLRQLDDKQQELIRDNLELKELCLYLDEERANVAANISTCTNCGASIRPVLRDDGDGSSSSTNADEPMPPIRQFDRQIPVKTELTIRSILTDQTLQYVKSLERKIRQMEEENLKFNSQKNSSETLTEDPAANRPEAVVRALQILEVREQLEKEKLNMITFSHDQIDDDEDKNSVQTESYNVPWSTDLEDSSTDPGLDHNLI